MAFDHLVFPVHHSDLPRFCLVLHEGENSHGASQDLVSDLIQHVLDMSIKVFFGIRPYLYLFNSSLVLIYHMLLQHRGPTIACHAEIPAGKN